MVVRCLFSACTVHKEQRRRKILPGGGACTVLVRWLYGAKRTKRDLGARCLFGADYSKEEQQTNQSIAMI